LIVSARSLSDVLPAPELDVLVAAAYLHDIGYAPLLARTGLHPLDGACFLRSLGRERMACLVAHHSGARVEAEERGLSEALNEFPEERSLVADVRTYCDLATTPDGADSARGAPVGGGCTLRRRPSGRPGGRALA
jgi:HD domain